GLEDVLRPHAHTGQHHEQLRCSARRADGAQGLHGAGFLTANAADSTSASTAPGPTVTPMACSTGTVDQASTPKPMTVVKLATPIDSKVSSSSSSPSARRSKNSA